MANKLKRCSTCSEEHEESLFFDGQCHLCTKSECSGLRGRVKDLSEERAQYKAKRDKLQARVAELEKAGFQLGEMLDYRVKRIMELEVELNRCLGSLGVLLATEGHVANWDGVRGIIEQAARVAK